MTHGKQSRYSHPVHINEVLRELIGNNSGTLFSNEDVKIFKIWKQVVDEEISSHAKPISFKNGKLVLMVIDPIWRNELNFLKSDIIASLNKFLGKKKVHHMELTLYDNNGCL